VNVLESNLSGTEEEKSMMRKKLEELISSCEMTSTTKLKLESLVEELRKQNAGLLKDCKKYPRKISDLKVKLKVRYWTRGPVLYFLLVMNQNYPRLFSLPLFPPHARSNRR
jgi:hypothetical protein